MSATELEAVRATGADPGPPGRRPRRAVVLGAVAALGAGALAAAGVVAGTTVTPPPPPAGPPATAVVERTALVRGEEVEGELGFGPATTVGARTPGTVTAAAAAGSVVDRGQELFRVDDAPVLLLVGPVPAYRDLGPGAEGPDVRQLEENLRALGHGGFTVDDSYTPATAAAVARWQRDLGLERTGRVELGRVVFAPSAVRVAEVLTAVGAEAGPGVLSVTGTERRVTVALDVADRDLVAEGARVEVALPGSGTAGGTVTGVGRVATAPDNGDRPGGGGGDPTITVTIALDADAGAALDVDRAPVTVELVAERREGVLAVPVAALLALPDGGYGVEVVETGGTRVVPVDTGLFARGRVEISGAGIAEGTVVGVPAR